LFGAFLAGDSTKQSGAAPVRHMPYIEERRRCYRRLQKKKPAAAGKGER
jgi:hypothetical protein